MKFILQERIGIGTENKTDTWEDIKPYPTMLAASGARVQAQGRRRWSDYRVIIVLEE